MNKKSKDIKTLESAKNIVEEAFWTEKTYDRAMTYYDAVVAIEKSIELLNNNAGGQ